jgi:hypothetical protein
LTRLFFRSVPFHSVWVLCCRPSAFLSNGVRTVAGDYWHRHSKCLEQLIKLPLTSKGRGRGRANSSSPHDIHSHSHDIHSFRHTRSRRPSCMTETCQNKTRNSLLVQHSTIQKITQQSTCFSACPKHNSVPFTPQTEYYWSCH